LTNAYYTKLITTVKSCQIQVIDVFLRRFS